jgi:hypothetical protein
MHNFITLGEIQKKEERTSWGGAVPNSETARLGYARLGLARLG